MWISFYASMLAPVRQYLKCLLLFGVAGFTMAADADAAVFSVMIEDNIFVPDLLNIHIGDTVVWTQNGGDHDVVQDDKIFSSGDLIPFGQTYSFTLQNEGSFGYYCSQHGAPGSGMAATIVVEA